MSMNLGAMFMSNNGAYEPQRSYSFVVNFSGSLGRNVAKTLTLAVQSFPLPTESSGVITVDYGNTKVKFAGQVSWNAGSLTLRDFISEDTEAAIMAWRQMVYNPQDDSVGWAKDYKQTATIYEVAPDGSYSRQWTLVGCWPSDVDYGNLDYTSDTLKLITVTIQYDKAYRDGPSNHAGLTPVTSSSSAYKAPNN